MHDVLHIIFDDLGSSVLHCCATTIGGGIKPLDCVVRWFLDSQEAIRQKRLDVVSLDHLGVDSQPEAI